VELIKYAITHQVSDPIVYYQSLSRVPDSVVDRPFVSGTFGNVQFVVSILTTGDTTGKFCQDSLEGVISNSYDSDFIQLIFFSYALHAVRDNDSPVITPAFVKGSLYGAQERINAHKQDFMHEFIIHIVISLEIFYAEPDPPLSVIADYIREHVIHPGFVQGQVSQQLLSYLQKRIPAFDSGELTISEQISNFILPMDALLRALDIEYADNILTFLKNRLDTAAFRFAIGATVRDTLHFSFSSTVLARSMRTRMWCTHRWRKARSAFSCAGLSRACVRSAALRPAPRPVRAAAAAAMIAAFLELITELDREAMVALASRVGVSAYRRIDQRIGR
jgi:hypothetical protein